MTKKNDPEKLEIIYKPASELILYARNARLHSDAQIKLIVNSIRRFGWTNPVLIDERGEIIAGHGRVMAAEEAAIEQIPCIVLCGLSEDEKRAYRLADNKIPLNSGWDEDLLKIELTDLLDSNFDIDLTGFSQSEIDDLLDTAADSVGGESRTGNLSEKFLVPPFSVLNAREGWWQERKQNWISIGIQSESGRDSELLFNKSSQSGAVYDKKNAYEAKIGRTVSWNEFFQAHPDLQTLPTTSIFDPVICELAYRWFSPEGGVVVDPFAGGSVRGIVAAKLGRQYLGCDLRAEQVDANRQQWDQIDSEGSIAPCWHCGDSRNIHKHLTGTQADFLFSCPPYADLEVYSDDPADISTLVYPEFISAYREIVKNALSLLKNDRFACFVVGEVRDKQGFYRNFVSDTVAAFRDAGAEYYNEAILVTQAGSLPVRAGKMFSASRKLGKTHQNVLVFVKGDPRKAVEACGEVDTTDIFPDESD
ncbi:site-specific DNA-methyltransferase [Enterobacteriaceae bacterium ESL0689]|nr:site-specific DNA-methyltransferase [Enterobacteriaceae bacterium ESL0689]